MKENQIFYSANKAMDLTLYQLNFVKQLYYIDTYIRIIEAHLSIALYIQHNHMIISIYSSIRKLLLITVFIREICN